MANTTLTFDQLPGAVAQLCARFEVIEKFIIEKKTEAQPESDKWLNVDELIDYLPDKPARATIYGKVHAKKIPYHKQGKSLIFRKSEIDGWLDLGRFKTTAEIEAEATNYAKRKR